MSSTCPTLKELVGRLKKAGRRCTLLGVGPVSNVVVQAAFESCREYRCPPILIASRNQVDLESLGSGYLMGGMDQRGFVNLLRGVQAESGYEGPVYICRDHGGPWQRNEELNGKYEVERAMAVARESFRGDIEAGFNYLHIDPTKCPFPYTQEQLCDWTVDLVDFCERARRDLSKPAIDYEVGTEDIQGGLTRSEAFEAFLANLIAKLSRRKLPLPTCIVGQTGTLTRLDRNVGRFDETSARELAAIAARHDVGFKEHNGDYLDAPACRAHPEVGVTGMNVAPEFGLIETDACLDLAEKEEQAVRSGRLADEDASHLCELFTDLTFRQSPWRKWMTAEINRLDDQAVARDGDLRRLIARVCGHYVYDTQAVQAARRTLYENLRRLGAVEDPHRYVIGRVRERIEFYLDCFALRGVLDGV